MRRGLVAIAAGAFALGLAEFGMMGMLESIASGLEVSVPWAGNFISAYAIGVCVGTLFLVFGRRVAPKRLLLLFMGLVVIGNALAAISLNAGMLVAARFISGLPHGAYFGTATIVAKSMAERGREGQAVAMMVLGQTIANTVGVPAATLIAGVVSWRAALAIIALWAVGACLLIARWVPRVDPIHDAGLAGQFRFLRRPGPWLVLGAVLAGNSGIFCWWSYVNPWLTQAGGFPEWSVPLLLVVAGLGMVVGTQLGGRTGDRLTPAKAAAIGQGIAVVALLLIFACSAGHPVIATALMFVCSLALFFPSSPQQILMVQVGRGGGEMIGSACVQVAFNAGNAIGAHVGQLVLNTGASYVWPSLAGAPITACSVVLLLVFARHFERTYYLEAHARPGEGAARDADAPQDADEGVR